MSASAVPIPKPRLINQTELKKPVPLPRKSIQQPNKDESPPPESQNTFSRRIRTLSSTSKQLTDEFSEKVQETKKAVIESTRQSVRRIQRKFSGTPADLKVDHHGAIPKEETFDSDLFDSIRFQSPLTIEDESVEIEEHIYSNQDDKAGSDSDEFISLPPPSHPPPPLPDESMYDRPQSVTSRPARLTYEAVFPMFPPPPTTSTNNINNNPVISTQIKINNSNSPDHLLSTPSITTNNNPKPEENPQRCESWSFYDPVTLNEVTYENELELKSGNRSSDSGSSAYSELNSCYENYIIELHRKNEVKPPVRTPRVTKSTIFEFDPLLQQQQQQQQPNEIAMLDHLLQQDLYGNTLDSYDQWSISSETDEYINPPTPPTRIDSLGEELAPKPTESKSNWFVEKHEPSAPVIPVEAKKSNWMKQLNDVLKKVPDSARQLRGVLNKDKYLDRPSLNDKTLSNHRGVLFKINRKSVEDLFGEFIFRMGVLGNGALAFYSDNGCDNIKEFFSYDSILSVQSMDRKIKLETELFCFEVSVSGKSGRGGHVFGCTTEPECKQWMQKIAEALTNRFPMNVVSNYKRMGWAYLKEGVSGVWHGAWIIVSSRCLYYAKDKSPMCTVDLRKARCIQLQEPDPDSPKTTDKGPNLLVDTQDGTVYCRIWTARETKLWSIVIQSEAYRNGRKLEEQQLTKDNVPVIVEKCINFIYAHGSMSEGIYRRSGSSSTVSEILGLFHQNAWSVTLTLDNCNEHDIANVLKRFLRSLPDPILTSKSSKYLCQIADSFQNTSEKVKLYKSILEEFPPINYKTLQRLLGHLHFIQSQSDKNRMSVDNLAAILGPTLVHHDGADGEWSPTESNLVVQLISMYRDLFPISTEELDKERLMLQVLERCHRGATTGQGPAHMKASGDLRVWIHLREKNGEAINITIGPQKLAADICMELSEKMKTPAYDLQLEELVLNDSLRRPVHYSEKVLDVVLRWGYWDESDRKDNCLVLTTTAKYKEFDKAPDIQTLSEELKFADNKTKAFKPYTFQFAQFKLCYFKDKLGNSKVQEWNIEDILWYFGHEHRHNPQTKWSLTFILRKIPPRRTKAIPHFGYTIGGNDRTSRINWVSSMIRAEHKNGLKPPLMQIKP